MIFELFGKRECLSYLLHAIQINELDRFNSSVKVINKSVVISGESGIGKSSLLLSFIHDQDYSWLADDISIIGKAGVSGVTFPILLRGYGEMPVKINFDSKVNFLRMMKKLLFKFSFKE